MNRKNPSFADLKKNGLYCSSGLAVLVTDSTKNGKPVLAAECANVW
jgi:hypothetical protein